MTIFHQMKEDIVIRSSLLTSYNDCPRRSAAQTFRDLVLYEGHDSIRGKVTGVAATLGSACHAGVELSLETKMLTGEPAPLKTCIDYAVAEFENQVSEAEGLFFDQTTKSIPEGKDQIVAIQKVHYNTFLPTINPKLIETQFYAKLGGGFVLSGKPDLITQEGVVEDFKTGLAETNYMAQVGAYGILAISNSVQVNKGKINCVPRTPLTKVIEPYEVECDFNAARMVAINTLRQIKNNINEFLKTGESYSFPANSASKLCSEKYCPAYATKFCECTFNKPTKKRSLI